MAIAALDRLAADRIAIMGLADAVQQALTQPATTRDLQQVCFELIDGNDRRIRPYLLLEERLLHGIWSPGAAIRAEQGSSALASCFQMLRRTVESGRPLRPALEDIELELRAFVEMRERLSKDVRRGLPGTLEQIETRFEAYEARLVRPQSLATR